MNQADRRAVADYIRELDPKVRSALESEDIEVFAYYGFGTVLNSAQVDAWHALMDWGPGTVHLWRWANRTGKTTGSTFIHLWAIWKKWRYENASVDDWANYTYRTLHAAPLNRLMGKAWEAAESLINGSAIQQRDPFTNLQRKGWLQPFFTARSGKTPDGSDSMWVECVNGGRVDFLSTHDGAGRMESETWWLFTWDEFVRHQPVTSIPLLFDQTFLPRSSDYMAPIILSGTVTEESDPIYAEMEEVAAESPKDWNIMAFDRSVNFSQSQESIDRQMRLSIDKNIAGRSVLGKLGEGGKGALYPTFLLTNAFDHSLPESISEEDIEYIRGMGYKFVSMFDHAATGDLNVVQTWAIPNPMPDPDEMIGGILAVGLAEKRSGGHITPTLQARFAADEVERFGSSALIVDGTGEGGALVYQGLRHDLAGSGTMVIRCDFSMRGATKGTSNKEEGLQALQRLMGWGLDILADENGWVGDWPEIGEDDAFGLIRIPFEGKWKKLHRELAVLKRDDAKQRQDRAMTSVMGAWYIRKNLGARRQEPQRFSIIPTRRRPSRAMSVVR